MNSLRIPRVSAAGRAGRKGIVLILSLGMLTLFTIVAITLASISRTQSTAAANFKRAEQYGRQNAGVRPEQVEDLFRYAVNQLIYDTRNPQSAIRGHSLLRDMYGSPETYEATRTTTGTPPDTITFPSLLTEVEGNGAELRLRKDDLRGLMGLQDTYPTENDPRFHYQGVYNGTGLPLPTKVDLGSYVNFSGTPAGVDAEQLRLSKSEIALQMAFPHMPLSVVPFGRTFLPFGSSVIYPSLLADVSTTLPPAAAAMWFPRFPLNYTIYDPFGSRAATTPYPGGSPISPERFFYYQGSRTDVRPDEVGFHWFGADEDYDYADINNMFLALERADGRMLIPSFHRPGIISQTATGLVELANNEGVPLSLPARLTDPRQIPWLTSAELVNANLPRDIRSLVLRPRAADYDPRTLGVAVPKAGRFKELSDSFARPNPSGPIVPGQDGLPDDLDGSGFVGDHPSELDVDTDGDGLNDAIWIDLGYKPVQVGDAIIKPLFAFKVLDLDGKLNLNVHGNLYRPNQLAGAAINPIPTPGQHSSHLGASVTEINPVHGLIIGDTPTDVTTTTNLNEPYRPVWFFDRTVRPAPATPAVPLNQLAAGPLSYPHPYQRLLEGFTDAAGNYHPGRWSSMSRDATILPVPGIAGLDENGNFSPNLFSSNQTLNYQASGTAVPAETQAQNRVRSSLHSVGDGRAVVSPIGTLAPGIPATSSPQSPADAIGIGRTLSPWSQVALSVSNGRTKSNLRWDDGNLLPLFINHPVPYSTSPLNPFGSYVAPNALSPWGVNTSLAYIAGTLPVTTVTDGGLVAELFTFDEALEVNPNAPWENDDFFYSAADLAAVWRAGDIDGPSSASRLTSILSSQVVSPTTDISVSSPAPTPPGYTQIEYARKRQQRMFTHASWDLNRYSSPPGIGLASLGQFLGGSVPSDVRSLVEAMRRSSTTFSSDVLEGITRQHSSAAVPSILSNQLANLLPDPVAGSGTPLLSTLSSPPLTYGTNPSNAPYAGTPYMYSRLAMEHLATRRTADGKDFLIPFEVQMGRRFDLNRPLTAYALANAQKHSRLLRLPGIGASTTPGMPEDNLTGPDTSLVSPDAVDLERESMAQQLYVLLAISAGLVGDQGSSGAWVDTKTRLAQARVLAQIAVNIVDYMDPDSVMTQMTFDPYLADGWSTGTGAAPPVPGINWVPDYPRLSDSSIDPAFASPPTSDQWRAACTVIGFELPDLVVSEAVSVVQENWYKPDGTAQDPNPSPVRNEVLNTFVELMNPWPGTPDPVSPYDSTGTNIIRGIRLYDPVLGQPRFMVSITSPQAGITPLTPDLTSNGSNYRSMVRFDPLSTGTGPITSDGYVLQPTGLGANELYVASRDGAQRTVGGTPTPDPLNTGDYGYFVIGPDVSSFIETAANPPQKLYGGKVINNVLLSGVDPTSAANLAQTVDYAATACGQVVPNTAANGLAGSGKVEVDVKLYRVRNPFRPFDKDLNPYVVVDTVRMSTSTTTAVEERFDRGTNGNLGSPVSPASTVGSGIYYSPDPNPGMGNMSVSAGWDPMPNVGARTSWQRRQPWHGWSAEFDPYDLYGTAAATHPLADLRPSGGFSTRRQNLEGLYLGLPSLASARDAGNVAEIRSFNAMRQNGFVPMAPTLTKASSAGATPDRSLKSQTSGKQYARWQTFPFANRQLATPLELLNVKLYGSHLWSVGGIFEWRLRFTDDCEFMTSAYHMPDVSGALPNSNPFYERTWRSRPIPWFQSDRVSHPTWGQAAGSFGLTAYDPATLPTTVSNNRPQFQLPLGNLHRFFELVECRSRLHNGSKPGEQWVQDTLGTLPLVPATASGFILRSNRQDRVPGKINLNSITEEEVYKGLIDSVSAMYFDPSEYAALFSSYLSNSTGPSALTVATANYWPVDYWMSLFTSLGPYPLNNPATGQTVDVLGDVVPWRSLSFAQAAEASVLSPPGSGSTLPIIASWGGMDLAGGVGLTTSDYVTWETSPTPLIRSINNQWPGIAQGPLGGLASPGTQIYPGSRSDQLVSSEMYRSFLMSRAGADGITGTADDRPFRSFGAADVEETILRSRSPQVAGSTKPATITVTNTGAILPLKSDPALAIARTWVDSAHDITSNQLTFSVPGGSPVNAHLSLGSYNIRLGGQESPRLFDPVPNPYADDPSVDVGRAAQYLMYTGASFLSSETQSNALMKYQRPDFDTTTGLPKSLPVDYWMLDEKRNSILAKIGGNTTTRSHVFAVWVTVGFFRVEPGTENLKVPLLGAEVGSETGRAKRHRAFFIVDRSQATEYEPEDIDANFDLDRLRNRRVLEYYKIIE